MPWTMNFGSGSGGGTGEVGGSGFFFPSESDRDAFFSGSQSGRNLLETNIPCAVNVGQDTVSFFIWSGADEPTTYDPELWVQASVEVAPGTLFLGEDGASIGSGSKVISFKPADNTTEYITGIAYNDAGSSNPSFYKLDTATFNVLASVMDTTLADPVEGTYLTTTSEMFLSFNIIPATSGELRTQIWLGTSDIGPQLVDFTNTVFPSEIGSPSFHFLPNNILIESGTNLFIRFSGIQLTGGLQTSGPFNGQTFPWLEFRQQNAVKTDYCFQNDEDITQKAPAGQEAFFKLVDSADVSSWTMGIVDAQPSNAIPSEVAPFGKQLTYNGGDNIFLSHADRDYDHAFTGAGEAYHAVSKDVTPADVGYKIYGSGDEFQGNYEDIVLKWNQSLGEYQLNTEAVGTGVKRDMSIDTNNITMNNTDIDYNFIDAKLVASSTSAFTSVQRTVESNKTLFSIKTNDSVAIHDVTDPTNIKHIKTLINPLLYPIQSYSAVTGNPNITRVNSVNSRIPYGYFVVITGGTYAGNHITIDTDPNGNYFDIDTPFAGNSAGTSLTVTLYETSSSWRLYGKYIYATSTTNDIYIYEIRDNDLFPIGGLPTNSAFDNLRDIIKYGNYAYAICSGSLGICGISVIDVTNPARPVLLNDISSSIRYFRGEISGNVLYVTGVNADPDPALTSFDITDPANPVILDSIAGHGENLNTVRIKGNVAYICGFTNSELFSVDISDPSNLVELDSITTITNPSSISIFGNYLIVNSGTPSIQFIDISDPSNMQIIGTGDPTFNYSTTGVFIVGQLMYLPSTSTGSLNIFNLGGINVPAGNIGSLEVGRLFAEREATFNNVVNIKGPFNVGGPPAFTQIGSIASRTLYGKPNDIVYIEKAEDFPGFGTGTIKLEVNKSYVLTNPTPGLGQNVIVLTDEIELFDGVGAGTIISDSLGSCILTYIGGGTMFNSTKDFQGFFSIDATFCSAPGGTLFNITGSLPVGQEIFTRLNINQSGFFDFDSIGTISVISFNYSTGAFFAGTGGLNGGITFNGCREAIIENVRFTDWSDILDTILIIIKGENRLTRISGCSFIIGPNTSIFNISPLIGSDNEILISNNILSGGRAFFNASGSGTITSITNASTSGAVTSVTDSGGDAQFNGVGFVLFNFQTIVLSGFSEPSYNGTFLLTAVSATTFKVMDSEFNILPFVVNSSGSYSAGTILVTTDQTNLVTNGDIINITGTINYDGGAYMFNDLGTSFQISRTFSVIETPTNGKWSANSLMPSEERVQSLSNAGILPSRPLASITAQGGDNATIITILGVYVNINVAATPSANAIGIELPSTSRWTLLNKGDLQVRYDGLEAFEGTIFATITGISSGSPREFAFRAVKNGTAIPNVFSSQELGGTSGNMTLIVPVSVVKNDTIRLQVANLNSTDDIVIQRCTITIQ